MRALVARDLADAQAPGLSADRRFATAYDAALQAANMAIACAGYRVTAKTGHHKVTVEAITLAVGTAVSTSADYFETCRRKRNVIDYTRSHVVTDTEADENRKQGARVLGACREVDRIEVPDSQGLRARQVHVKNELKVARFPTVIERPLRHLSACNQRFAGDRNSHRRN